jgi:tetratricopeptide (TPR) repeat protein
MTFRLLSVVVLLVLFSSIASAQEIFKWKDKRGQWHFSDLRPPPEVEAEEVKPGLQPSVSSQNISDDAVAYIEQGIAYASYCKYDQAIASFDHALEINPRYAKAYTHRGNVYWHKGQYNQAIANYSIALELNPRDVMAFNNRGISYVSKGRYDQAIADFDRALEINPRYAKAYVNRGNVYWHRGQYDQAVSDYNKALDINSRNAAAHNNRGILKSLGSSACSSGNGSDA